jgi:ubiquinone/menaquinone biosynthesis C-methylase UbiE
MNNQLKVLEESQVQSFDVEYVNEEMWAFLQNAIYQTISISGSKFSFLDIGGGNGKFTDRVLSSFTESNGYLFDNSSYLLSLNTTNQRKTVVSSSVEEIENILGDQKFDIIFMNWVLHHFVTGSYSSSMKTQVNILRKARKLLNENGKIIVLENLPEGIFGETICSFIINRITSSKILAPIVKKMGGNTAGVGICFLGEKQWLKQFLRSELSVEMLFKTAKFEVNPIKKALLTIKDIRVGIFVLNKI